MFNSHMNQRVVLNETESPRVFGNYENIVGEYSSFNHKAKSEMELLNVIYKFPKMKDSLDFQKAYFFVYDKASSGNRLVKKLVTKVRVRLEVEK